MTFTESISVCFSKYATFDGRATRSEYWWFCLFNVLVTLVSELVIDRHSLNKSSFQESAEVFSLIINLALLLPTLAVTSRRLHDINKSGWWQLLSFTVIGLIPLFIWLARKSSEASFDDDSKIPITSGQFEYSKTSNVNLFQNSLNNSEKIIMAGFDSNGNVLRLSFNLEDQKLINSGLILGRDFANCDLYISDHSISRRHAKIYKKNEQIWIEDLNSTNGMIVNGKSIKSGESALLSTTGSLSIGGIELTLGRG
jgi:uncharacterized membrane protein YhaH (DUF805 family)